MLAVDRLRQGGLSRMFSRWRSYVSGRQSARGVLRRLVRHSRDRALGVSFGRWVRACGASSADALECRVSA